MGLDKVVELEQSLGAWRGELIVSTNGAPKPLLSNALLALKVAPEWAGVLAYDEFSMATIAARPPPWLVGEDNSWTPRRWSDVDDTLATAWLNEQGISVAVGVTAKAVEAAARDQSFHPVRDYLAGLAWDGTNRVEAFASRYLGAEPSEYLSAVSRCFLVAAVARILAPGCKVDTMLILEGPQDLGKSSGIELMFKPWFTDDLAELGSKDASMQVAGVWGVEVAELASMTRGEIERVKAFVTRKVDRFRPSYGRHVIEAPRQCVFVGSTNDDAYLKDETGARRFWPIKCGKIDLNAIEADRDQLWAEAKALYDADEIWWLTGRILVAAARDEQAGRYAADPWFEAITRFVGDRTEVAIPDILQNCLEIEKARWTRPDQMRVGGVLKAQGWQRHQVRNGHDRSYVYRRGLIENE